MSCSEAADVHHNGAGAEPQAATTRVSAEQFLQSTAPGVYPDLDKARRAQSDAAEAYAVLSDASERSQNEHQQAMWRLDRARAAVEHARAGLEAALAGLEAEAGASRISSEELVATTRRART